MSGAQGEEEIADIMTKVYKIRPFGVEAVNMRELNPTGEYPLSISRQFPDI
jgi:DNA replication licensing factor MCM4